MKKWPYILVLFFAFSGLAKTNHLDKVLQNYVRKPHFDIERTFDIQVNISSIDSIHGKNPQADSIIRSIITPKLHELEHTCKMELQAGNRVKGVLELKLQAFQYGQAKNIQITASNNQPLTFQNTVKNLFDRLRFGPGMESFIVRFNILHPDYPPVESLIPTNHSYSSLIQSIIEDENVKKQLIERKTYYPIRFLKVWQNDLNNDGENDVVVQCIDDRRLYAKYLSNGEADLQYFYLITELKNGKPWRTAILENRFGLDNLEITDINRSEIHATLTIMGLRTKDNTRVPQGLKRLSFIMDSGNLYEKSYIGSEAQKLMKEPIFTHATASAVTFNAHWDSKRSEERQNDPFLYTGSIEGRESYTLLFTIQEFAPSKDPISENTVHEATQRAIQSLQQECTRLYKNPLGEVLTALSTVHTNKWTQNQLGHQLSLPLQNGGSALIRVLHSHSSIVIRIEPKPEKP